MNKEAYLRKKLIEDPSSPLALRLQREEIEKQSKAHQEEIKKREAEALDEVSKCYIRHLTEAGFDSADANFLAVNKLEGLYDLTSCNDTHINKEMFVKAATILSSIIPRA